MAFDIIVIMLLCMSECSFVSSYKLQSPVVKLVERLQEKDVLLFSADEK